MLVLTRDMSYMDTTFKTGEVFTPLPSEEREVVIEKFFSSMEKFRTKKYYSFGHFSDGKKRFVHIDFLKVV